MPHSRSRPAFPHQEYYQTWSDILFIFALWDQLRREMGERVLLDPESDFHADAAILPFTADNWTIPYLRESPLTAFSKAIRYTSLYSWREFLGESAFPGAQRQDELEWLRNDPFLRALLQKAVWHGNFSSQVQKGENNFSLSRVGKAGMDTGAEVTTQLTEILGREFTNLAVVAASKVHVERLGHLLLELGMPHSLQGPFFPEDLSLIDPQSRVRLHLPRLQELGYSKALGCPAGRPPTGQTRQYLQELLAFHGYGDLELPRTMLDAYCEWVQQEYHEHILGWYDGLSEEQREAFLTRQAREIMDGTLLEQLRASREPQEGREGRAPRQARK